MISVVMASKRAPLSAFSYIAFEGVGSLALGGIEDINAGAILRADVVALAHALSRIVVLPEHLEQALIRDFLRIVDHENDLVVTGAAAADLLVCRIGRMAGGIADGRDVNAVAKLPKLALRAPETAHAEHRGLKLFGIWPLQRAAIEEVLLCRPDRRRPAR